MFFLKRKVRNKNKVEGSISAQYIYEEVAHFCARYLSDEVETVHNQSSRNDINVQEKDNGLSVFRMIGQPFKRGRPRMMTKEERDAVQLYVLDNMEEVAPFAE